MWWFTPSTTARSDQQSLQHRAQVLRDEIARLEAALSPTDSDSHPLAPAEATVVQLRAGMVKEELAHKHTELQWVMSRLAALEGPAARPVLMGEVPAAPREPRELRAGRAAPDESQPRAPSATDQAWNEIEQRLGPRAWNPSPTLTPASFGMVGMGLLMMLAMFGMALGLALGWWSVAPR